MRRVLSGLAVAGLLVTQQAGAQQMCPSPADQQVFELQALKSALMVLATSCHSDGEYNAFVNRYKTDLAANEQSFDEYFRKRYGKQGQREHDAYITSLANAQSDVGMHLGSDFCPRDKALFTEVLALRGPSDLGAYAAGKDLVPASLGACAPAPPIPSRSVVRAQAAAHTAAKSQPQALSSRGTGRQRPARRGRDSVLGDALLHRARAFAGASLAGRERARVPARRRADRRHRDAQGRVAGDQRDRETVRAAVAGLRRVVDAGIVADACGYRPSRAPACWSSRPAPNGLPSRETLKEQRPAPPPTVISAAISCPSFRLTVLVLQVGAMPPWSTKYWRFGCLAGPCWHSPGRAQPSRRAGKLRSVATGSLRIRLFAIVGAE